MRILICLIVLVFIPRSASKAVSQSSFSHLSPANVFVLCDNYGVEIRWDYPDSRHDVRFLVEVNDHLKQRNHAETQNRFLNISSMLSRPAYNNYNVTVTAVWRGRKLGPSSSVQFTFNQYGSSKIKCRLDFPEVELSPRNNKLRVRFINPLHLYSNSPALRNSTEHLTYFITTETIKIPKYFICNINNRTCEVYMNFSEIQDVYCVYLEGEIGQIRLNNTSSCYTGELRDYPPITVLLYSLLGVCVTLLVITSIILLLVKKCNAEIKKKASSAFPSFLEDMKSSNRKPLEPKLENMFSSVLIEPADPKPKQQALLLEDSNDLEQPFGSTDLENTDTDTKSTSAGSVVLDDELDELQDGYDCPHALKMEMDDGDIVDAYGPRGAVLDL
ncbi:interferon gamma receptor 1 isoform X2 [Danio aesculapii]|uniref:interferon gamma receptor 1 isoform X2 n=1 Tax=Danio aesculapii TaxID=1142201 RepID=UPI0024C04EC3|nr:interferon gamma receptor 1 isoform X2 [Danio aesculapii]